MLRFPATCTSPIGLFFWKLPPPACPGATCKALAPSSFFVSTSFLVTTSKALVPRSFFVTTSFLVTTSKALVTTSFFYDVLLLCSRLLNIFPFLFYHLFQSQKGLGVAKLEVKDEMIRELVWAAQTKKLFSTHSALP